MSTAVLMPPIGTPRLPVTDEAILEWLYADGDDAGQPTLSRVERELEQVSIPNVGTFTRETVRDCETGEVLFVSFST